jgi:glutamine cyclotransferase
VRAVAVVGAALLASGIVEHAASRATPSAPRQSYTVVHSYPHDSSAFTQGLEYADGFLYEGTGLNGRSSIRKVKLETGEVVQRRDVSPEYFGEGITLWKSELIELTWRSQIAFVYNRQSFEPKKQFTYSGEGWGLTHDDRSLIMSDGSASLRYLSPTTFAEQRRVLVTDGGAPVTRLNELEYVRGEIFANVWQTERIVRVAPDSGRVLAWVNLRGLLAPEEAIAADAVLNGIAYDAEHDRLFVTGKLWPKVFEIKIR